MSATAVAITAADFAAEERDSLEARWLHVLIYETDVAGAGDLSDVPLIGTSQIVQQFGEPRPSLVSWRLTCDVLARDVRGESLDLTIGLETDAGPVALDGSDVTVTCRPHGSTATQWTATAAADAASPTGAYVGGRAHLAVTDSGIEDDRLYELEIVAVRGGGTIRTVLPMPVHGDREAAA